jgi:hypothetical protein
MKVSDEVEEEPNLATVLSDTAARYLGIDFRGDTKQALFVGHLLDEIQYLSVQVNSLHRRLAMPPPPPSESDDDEKYDDTPRLQVLHEVLCNSTAHEHYGAYYLDEPVQKLVRSIYGEKWILVGKDRISDIEDYVLDHPEVCILMFKEHVCDKDQASPLSYVHARNARELRTSPRNERLRIVSGELKSLINEIATFQPNTAIIQDHNELEMLAPYPFFFHHRRFLTVTPTTANAKLAQEVAVLTEFLETHYRAEYEEAEKLFSAGMISQKHLDKLFKPNDLVISHARGKSEAYVLVQSLSMSAVETQLSVWSWQSRSSHVSRAPKWIMVEHESFGSSGEIPIQQLTCYPKKYAPADVIEKLESRGRKFWSMRTKTFATYSGWDSNHGHCYVGGIVARE